MKGTILGAHDGRGVLIGADERRRDFPLSEWRSPGAPTAGQAVDFIEAGDEARSVFLAPGAGAQVGGVRQSPSFVLGAISVCFLAVGFLIPLLPTIGAFVFGILGVQQAERDGDSTGLLLSRIGWIGALVMLIIGALAVIAAVMLLGGVFALTAFQLGPID